MRLTLRLAVAAATMIWAAPPAIAAAPLYTAQAPVPLPDGRWDLLSFDPVHDRVVIGRGENVSVVDIAAKTARSIGTVEHGHAALLIPGTNTVAVTSGQDNTLRLLDADSGRETAKILVGEDPDAAIWDLASHRLLVMNAKGGSVSVVDTAAGRVERTIAVKPALELASMIAPGLIAINDEDANEIELVDLTRGIALAPIALKGCEGPTGIAFAPEAHLLLSACANGQAALADTNMRKLVKLLPIGQGPDGALYDPVRRRFLVPCGKSGTLSVFALGEHGEVTALASVNTEVGARTAALDEATGRVFLPAARFGPAQAGKRSEMLPGTAHLIVLEPDRADCPPVRMLKGCHG